MPNLYTKLRRDRRGSSAPYFDTQPDTKNGFSVWWLLIILAVVCVLYLTAVPQFSTDYESQPSLLTAADKELANLEWQQMAYTAPERMEMGSTAAVTVALGGNRTFAELVPILENAGKAEGQLVQVSDRMEARLTGIGFEIIANTPETQLVSTTQPTRWQWEVKARDWGIQKLYLSLNVLLSVNGKDTQKSVRTFQREISIEVTSAAGTWAFLERYWTYVGLILTAVIIPLSVYFWKRFTAADSGQPLNKPNKSPKRKRRRRIRS